AVLRGTSLLSHLKLHEILQLRDERLFGFAFLNGGLHGGAVAHGDAFFRPAAVTLEDSTVKIALELFAARGPVGNDHSVRGTIGVGTGHPLATHGGAIGGNKK